MPDENERYDLPEDPDADDNEYTDDDVPFRLPKSETAGTFRSNIHKDDTDELIIPDDPFSEDQTAPRHADEEEQDIAALHASDPPLASGPPEDNTMVQRAGMQEADDDTSKGEDTGDLDQTVPHQLDDRIEDDESEYTTDADVPFRLPKHKEGEEIDDAPIGSKFVTMPNKPQTPGEMRTLPGTGGLDPNPDIVSSERTVPGISVPPAQQTAPPQERRYQRPQGARAYPPPPVQRDTPPAPNQQRKRGPVRPGSLPGRGRLRRMHPGCLILLVIMLTFCGGLTFVTAIAGAFAYVRVGELLNDRLEVIESYEALQSNTIVDRNGEELFTVFSEQGMRINVDLENLPQHVIDATLAIEDDSFYGHIGIDIGATSIALLQYIGASSDEETAGGSTITQQLVRNVLFDPEYRAERSPRRKAEEILLAIALEARKSKDDILELYLNEIYYGNLAYGIEAAAQTIFDKTASELTIGEAALLAGLPNVPAYLDPLSDDPEIKEAVESRRRQVLNEMLTDNKITQAQYEAAVNETLTFGGGDISLSAPHFTVHAQEELDGILRDQLGMTEAQIAQGGLNIMTSVDLQINDMAREIAAARIAELQGNNASNSAVIVLNPATGEILAMVGSVDYYNDAIDGNVNVTTRPRQPGSTMKPFTYAAAIERGVLDTADVIWDTRTNFSVPGQAPYVPRNYDFAFHGPMRMRQALANSYNIPAVKTIERVGVDYLLGFMERFGVESLGTDSSRYGLSLTLGGGEITLLELARGYAVFANEGQRIDTTSILCIWDNRNRILYEYNNSCPDGKRSTDTTVSQGVAAEQVLDPRIAYVIGDILGDNVARSAAMGSRSALYTPDIITSAKTGTTNDVKDNWTVGYTRNVVVGVWIGNNNGDPMTGISGLSSAAPIWNRVMTTIYSTPIYLNEFATGGQLRSDQRITPNGLSLVRLCNVRRLVDPATGCPAFENEWMLDSPAGQYTGNGNIEYGAGSVPQAENPPQTGAYLQLVEPGIYRTIVFRLDPNVANAIQFNVPAGETAPPPPLYCRVPVEIAATTPGAQEQLFIAPPNRSAAEAEIWARENNLAFLPTIDCQADLLVGGAPGSNILTAFISVPTSGQTVPAYTELAITGTAQFTPQQAEYYKVDLIGGDITRWTTISDVHRTSVVNGQLDVLPALPPGDYQLRLEIIGVDGNVAQQGFVVPFSVR